MRSETMRGLLAVSLRRIDPEATYRFCATETCAVVYYADDVAFLEADLRERVHQKAPHEADVPVCYCFNHSPGSIRAELLAQGRSTVIEDVTSGIQAGQCACDIRNPQGTCCLGNVRRVMAWLQEEQTVDA